MQNLLRKIAGFLICIIGSNLYAEKLAIVWEKEFGIDENLSYVAHDAIYTNGILSLTGYAFEPRTKTSTGVYWFWQINRMGNMLSHDNFYTVSNRRIDFGSWRTKGLKVDQSSMYCAGKVGSEESSLIGFGITDKKFFQAPIQPDPGKTSEQLEKEPAETILKMISLSDNKFLLVGQGGGSKGFAKKTNAVGNISWHKVYKKGKTSFIVDAIEMGDKLVLVDCHTEAEKNPYEGYSCRLLICDLEGNILSEKTVEGGGAFPNKFPELHKIDSSHFWVGHDKDFMPNRIKYFITAFDSNLTRLWEKSVFDDESKAPIYAHILPLTSGEFIAAYSKTTFDIVVTKYAVSGESSASLSLKNYLAIDNFLIVGSGDRCFIVGLSELKNDKGLVRTKIAALSIE